MPWGRALKVPEKAGWVGPDFIRTRLEVPPRGPRGWTPTFRGSGQVGVDSIDLGVPQGRALKVLRRSGRGGAGLGVSRHIGYPSLYINFSILYFQSCLDRETFDKFFSQLNMKEGSKSMLEKFKSALTGLKEKWFPSKPCKM